MNDKNKKILILILSILLVIALGSMFWLMPKVENSSNTQEPEVTEKVNYDAEIKLFDDNYAINDDYVGQIIFESGIIDLPVVQSQLEDVYAAYDEYLRTAWDTMEHDEEGSIFMDPNVNHETDQNIVIYGHYVYPFLDPEQTHKFSPLHLLKDETNYDANKNIKLILKDEIREYEVAYVYYAAIITDENGQYSEVNYMLPNFESEEFENYFSAIENLEFYSTGIEISEEDDFLTLQTCVENRDDLRLIIVAKETNRVAMR